jgi:hypothetical protein
MPVKNTELIPLFNKLKNIISAYSSYFDINENESGYSLVYKGEVKFNKYTRDEVYFVGVMIQKAYIGFYFIPQYSTEFGPEYFAGPNMLKLLKGKSCYYLKPKLFEDPEQAKALIDEIKSMLEKGLNVYKEKGWVR